MKEKIEFLLKNKRLTPTSFARMLDVQASGISHILSGRNKPSFDLVVKILRAFPDINPDWLLLNYEQPFRSDVGLPTTTTLENREQSPMESQLPFDAAQNSLLSESLPQQKNEELPIFVSSKNRGKSVERTIVLYADHSFDSYER